MNIDQHRKCLERWLNEYGVWRRLGPDAVDEAGEAERDSADTPDFAQEPAPATGQIRLWPAADPGDPPFYGLLAVPEYGTWGVLPFSPLSAPGTPEEMNLLEKPPVQVVQGWNLRRVGTVHVRNAWCAGRIPEAEIFRLEMFSAWLGSGEVPPFPLLDRLGPPLVHPLDPRYAYLEEERERADRTLGAASASGGHQIVPFSLAAEPQADYKRGRRPESGLLED